VAGARWPLHDLVSAYLDPAQCAAVWEATDREIRSTFAELSPPVAGAAEVIERVGRDYRLGLIANQGAECRAWLDSLGWLDRFEVVVLGEERGVFKPDPSLFRSALEQAGVSPDHALMVGDRLDNDVAPAASLGMATAWVRWPSRLAKGWPRGDDPEALAYLASLERLSFRAAADGPPGTPSIVLETIAGLIDVL
jgi:HAD superfamily hydrolase (TIGR01549 family)